MVTPTVADGTVYATLATLEEGLQSLVALNLADQTEQWRAESLGQRWAAEAPVPTLNVIDESVLVGEPGAAHCYDANSGKHRWSHRAATVGGGISASQDMVYLAAGDNGLEAIDLATGETGWRKARRPGDGNLTPPAVSEQLLFFFDQINGTVYSWAIEAWDLHWKHELEQGGTGGMALAGNTLYCTINDRILALDADSGDELWSTEIDLGRTSEPVVADGYVYLTATPFDHDRRALEGSRLFVLDSGDGTVEWTQRLTEGLPRHAPNEIVGYPNPPTVLDGVLLVPDVTGTIHRFESA